MNGISVLSSTSKSKSNDHQFSFTWKACVCEYVVFAHTGVYVCVRYFLCEVISCYIGA